MADYYFGVNKGLDLVDVTTDTSTTSKAIELRVADTVVNRQEVLNAMEHLKSFLLQNDFPAPAA